MSSKEKYFRCTVCWRKATHGIGYFDEEIHFCNKHWRRTTDKIRQGMIAQIRVNLKKNNE